LIKENKKRGWSFCLSPYCGRVNASGAPRASVIFKVAGMRTTTFDEQTFTFAHLEKVLWRKKTIHAG
jgi:hypothetical protein